MRNRASAGDCLARLPGRARAAFAAVVLVLLPLAAAAQPVSPSLRNDARTDSLARLLAGLPPSHPDHAALAQTRAWKEHSRALQGSWARVRDGQAAAVMAWRRTDLPRGCPAGNTLLYPFSGPDFLNAYWLFPDCATYVLFGLESTGNLPAVESFTGDELAQYLASVRSFMINLFARNYFVTETMLKSQKQMRGMAPALVVLMSLSGVEVLHVRKLELTPAMRPAVADAFPESAKRRRELRGIAIDYRVPGRPEVRRLNYFSLDATNAALVAYPEFLDYVRGLAPATMLIKSASYLLHGNEFSRVRDALLDAGRFIVQDDTGLPYARLLKRGWELKLYGKYGVPIPPFEYAYQPALAASYEKQKPRPLPFRFGYHLNLADDRSNLMVARLAAQRVQTRTEPVR